MPRIELIPTPLYGPLDPYHYFYDNLPLENMIRRMNLINLALDNVIEQTTDAIGTQGTFANRLNQSLQPDGSLITDAVDEALHSIEAHEDTATYVRMLATERSKLDLVADNATSLELEVQTDALGNTIVAYDTDVVRLVPSSTVSWEVQSPNKVTAHLSFPVESAHRHYYDQTPVPTNDLDPDYKNYKINSISSAYVAGSLRVFINGMRLSSSAEIYIAGALITDPWTKLSYTESPATGTFELSSAITVEDVIRIDYDLSYL